MKKSDPPQDAKKTSLKKMFLLSILLASGLIVCLDVFWFYRAFESGLGNALAQVVLAYHVILLLGMVSSGLWLGQWVQRLIREKRSIFRCPAKGSWAEALMTLWGYELKQPEESSLPNDPEPIPPAASEPFELLDLPTRRGRKPTFPLDRWLPIAVQWENRDPIRDAFTLAELISEHLGTNSDGSPIVSEQTYYSTWRPRAIAELRSRAQARKSKTE